MAQGKILKRLLHDYKSKSGKSALSKEEIAQKAGIGVATLYRYYTLDILDEDFIQKISSVLGVDPSVFIENDAKPIQSINNINSINPYELLREEHLIFKQQIAYQNSLIDRLMGMLELKLGKYDGAPLGGVGVMVLSYKATA